MPDSSPLAGASSSSRLAARLSQLRRLLLVVAAAAAGPSAPRSPSARTPASSQPPSPRFKPPRTPRTRDRLNMVGHNLHSAFRSWFKDVSGRWHVVAAQR
jgi:hypothetical protein